ncbi:RNA-binding protein 43-like [Megalops cyprinoides]|uniref:RNA-binding protein 43-like n=1 Tax=Megalops cyprinoides TaxID=118141 RepID=UPI001864BF13|nr:RNA-binding protein 43-like [Megalops cyprinoides]
MDQSEESRTVVVSGVPEILTSSRMADKLVIHFQRSRSNGGDVVRIQYPTNYKGVAFITFEDIEDAERVLKKEQIMQDKEFPKEYALTVFKFSDDVFFFVRAEVDLSLFSNYDKLIQDLQAVHRSVRISLLPSKGRVTVEGPFRAVRELREDLLRQARTGRDRRVGSRTDDQSADVLKGSLEDTSGDDQESSIWVDTNTLRYIQKFYSDDYDRCLSKYFVDAGLEEVGDLTLITLKGKGRSSSVRSAKSELEHLVMTRQSALRFQRIDYRSPDEHQKKKLLHLCRDLNALYNDILLIPLDSCIEVIGPSASSHLFCKGVEHRRRLPAADVPPHPHRERRVGPTAPAAPPSGAHFPASELRGSVEELQTAEEQNGAADRQNGPSPLPAPMGSSDLSVGQLSDSPSGVSGEGQTKRLQSQRITTNMLNRYDNPTGAQP